MLYSRPAIDLIKERTSIRTYTGTPPSARQLSAMREFLGSLPLSPLQSRIRFLLTASSAKESAAKKKLGTYGMIKKPAGFFIGAVTNGLGDMEDFGYMMQRIALMAQDLDLGTCWLGGSFRKSRFASAINASKNEMVPAVVAFGNTAFRQSLASRLVVQAVKARKRLAWEVLFFDHDLQSPLSIEAAGPYSVPLEMVRLAPSASNKQPWRIVASKQKKEFHFYIKRHKSYDPNRKKIIDMADLQRIDMGIAMCHFELAAEELNLTGKWMVSDPELNYLPEATQYIVTWKAEPPSSKT